MVAPLLERLARGPLLADGAMGTVLFSHGVGFDQCFDAFNLSQAGLVEEIHREYLAAGAELIETNTFGANPIRLAAHGLEDQARVIARQGARIARTAREIAGLNAIVAGSIGPLGKALEPFGPITPSEAEAAFRVAPRACSKGVATRSSSRRSRT
jgi:homocysteine S-methyltransferase